jgi:sodium-dependent dicarboxylate transporter 2/3/5
VIEPRRTFGLLLGPLVFVLVLFLPTDLPVQAQRLAAVFALVIVLWVTEAIPLAATALLGPALAVTLGVAPARDAFASFGHPIIFLFLGSFLISRGMTTHGLDRRIALFVLSRRWVGEHPSRILLAFGLIAWALSMWMSNTATTAMMLPIGLGVLGALGNGKAAIGGKSYATGLMLMIAFSCNIGGLGTPVGSPPNLIAIGMVEQIVGREIGFLDWMAFGVPIAILLFVLLYVVMHRLFLRDAVRLDGAAETILARRETLGPWSAGERVALGAFSTAVVLWTLPGVVGLAGGPASSLAESLKRSLPEGVSAILAATVLFVVPVDWRKRRFALGWKQAASIDWGTILLFGGGLSLGGLAFSSGLSEAIGATVESVAGGLPLWTIVLLALLTADLMTEFMSNTATANLLVPIFLSVAVAAGDGSLLPALAATLGCSLAFCLPVATPPNAIVYGSGHAPLTQMVRAGIWMDLGAAVLAWAALMALAGPLGLL